MGKEMLRKGPGAKKVRELLSNYVLALKNEYSSGLILPKKDQAAAPVKTSAVAKPANKPAGGQANEASMKALDLGCKLDLSCEAGGDDEVHWAGALQCSHAEGHDPNLHWERGENEGF